MNVGIRELKARLSEYLDRAGRGESIVITDRGRPKAVLAPLPGRLRIDQGIEDGWITPPRSGARRRGVTPARSDRSIAEILDEDRGE